MQEVADGIGVVFTILGDAFTFVMNQPLLLLIACCFIVGIIFSIVSMLLK